MKHILLSVLLLGACAPGYAQHWMPVTAPIGGGLHLNIGGMVGGLNADLTTSSYAANYTNAINADVSTPYFHRGESRGFNAQAEYFFGRKGAFGIGAGILWLHQEGQIRQDRFHVEYQATDFSGDVYRQVISSHNSVNENLRVSNTSIPVTAKYRLGLGRVCSIELGAGALFSVKHRQYTTPMASFDYEAVYRYDAQGNASYDNAPVPGGGDWLITQAQYSSHAEGGMAQYFSGLAAQGYNVGLNAGPKKKGESEANFKSTSVGFLLQPQLNIRVSRALSVYAGGYYLHQTFKSGESGSSYRLTDRVGEYNSLTGTISKSSQNSIGGSIGLRVMILGAD